MNLVELAARYSVEMQHSAMKNKHIVSIDKLLRSSIKYNSHRSSFKYMYGELRGAINGTGLANPTWFLCFGYPATT